MFNYRHPGPRRVWNIGSKPQSLTPFPLDPEDPQDPALCSGQCREPADNSFWLPNDGDSGTWEPGPSRKIWPCSRKTWLCSRKAWLCSRKTWPCSRKTWHCSRKSCFAPERLGLAPERLGFARIRKPATLIFGFGQGKSEYVHGKPVVLAKHGAYYSGLDIVGVCGAGYEHPGCWGLHI